MILIDTLISIAVLFFITKVVSKPLLEESKMSDRGKSLSILISILIVLGIIVGIRYIFGFLGYFLSIFILLNDEFFFFAIMTSIFYPLYRFFIKKFGNARDSDKKVSSWKKFIKRSIFVIGASWVTALIFLSIPLLNIPIGHLIPPDLLDPTYDVFLLGFEWTFFALIFYTILTKLVIRVYNVLSWRTAVIFLTIDLVVLAILFLGVVFLIFELPLTFILFCLVFLAVILYIIVMKIVLKEKQPPKDVVNNANLFGALVGFGIWSIQLIVVELYLKRLFGIILYQQDIRMLFIVIAIIYIACFLISLKYKYLPEAIKEDKKLIQEEMRSMEEGAPDIIENDVILSVEDLRTYFYTEEGVVHALEGVSFKIHQGEVLGLVGETGCGKTVTALSILQLIRPPGKIIGGKVMFGDIDLHEKSEIEILPHRGKEITMIFQDPLNSLNPVFKVGNQITEVFLLHKKKELLVESSKDSTKNIYSIAREWSQELLRDLNIPVPEKIFDQYPHELSGGMRQRIQIAMGLACGPKLLIADEPTTALDVTIQNQILKLMKDLKRKYNTAILFITHDLGIISKMCDKVAVMYSGFIVENGNRIRLFTNPYHPYTKGLISSIPIVGEKKELLMTIPGMVPNLIYPPTGCRFHPRCQYCFEPCDSEIPKSIEVDSDYFVACHLYDPAYKELAELSISRTEENRSNK